MTTDARRRGAWRPIASAAAVLPVLLLTVGAGEAGELVYRPVNPSFGGNPFNGSYLLGLAEAQKDQDHKDRNEEDSPLDDFSETLRRRLLSQVADNITETIFGDDAKDSGTIKVADTRIDFERIDGRVSIHLEDLLTGEATDISVPVAE